MTELQSFIAQQQSRTSALLLDILARKQQSTASAASDNRLVEAMRYSLLNGGKRIRPVLTAAAAHAVDCPGEATQVFAAALECIHAYSLIHDDLPAMDDDDLRRGNPTCHIAFDEATAILAGDGLQCLAFEMIAGAPADAATVLAAVQELAKASGSEGMVLGQAIDLASVDRALSLSELQNMHRHKTGALIEAAVILGGLSAGATDLQLAQLRQYAAAVGLAFQVQDDIIDVTSDTETLGKTQGADAHRNKPTYVSLLGLDGARQRANDLLAQALAALASFDERADFLRELAAYVVSRDH